MKKKYVYLVNHDGPLGGRTIGIYSTKAKADLAKKNWDKTCSSDWDYAGIYKSELDPDAEWTKESK